MEPRELTSSRLRSTKQKMWEADFCPSMRMHRDGKLMGSTVPVEKKIIKAHLHPFPSRIGQGSSRLLGGFILGETFPPSQHLLSPMHPLGAADIHVHPSW